MSKSDELMTRLREGWHSIDDLHALLFWQPHTIRGAISTAAKKHGVVIERAVTMWSNPGDVVLSPFMGIGSEGVTALKIKRKFIGIELKPSYFKHACRYLEAQERQGDMMELIQPVMEAL